MYLHVIVFVPATSGILICDITAVLRRCAHQQPGKGEESIYIPRCLPIRCLYVVEWYDCLEVSNKFLDRKSIGKKPIPTYHWAT